MRDRIDINGLTVTTVVGALPHEREIAQPLRIDLALHVDLRDAGRSDELGDTVHYGLVTEQVADVVRENKDVLLERLADRIAEVVVGFDRVEAVDVTVTKLRPPIGEHIETTAVRVSRTPADLDVRPRSSHRAIVALGSNLGDREGYLRCALGELGGIVATSQVFETDPVGGPGGRAPTSTWSSPSTRRSTRSRSCVAANASSPARCASASSTGARGRSTSTSCSTTTSRCRHPS